MLVFGSSFSQLIQLGDPDFSRFNDLRYLTMRRAEGEALWHLGRQTEAEAVYQALVKKLPNDAWAYIGWAERGQIHGGIIDGPLAFDDAVSAEAAQAKGIISPVAGHADILVVPDFESGTMLAKQLEYLARAQTADIVLGAQVPIILTNRSVTPLNRQASCAVALLLARHKDK